MDVLKTFDLSPEQCSSLFFTILTIYKPPNLGKDPLSHTGTACSRCDNVFNNTVTDAKKTKMRNVFSDEP